MPTVWKCRDVENDDEEDTVEIEENDPQRAAEKFAEIREDEELDYSIAAGDREMTVRCESDDGVVLKYSVSGLGFQPLYASSEIA